MTTKFVVAFAFAGILASSQAHAVTYTLNDSFDGFSVSGTVTTDGKLGVLSAADITDWNLGFGPIAVTLIPGNSTLTLVGNNLTATATNLLFDYSTFAFPDVPRFGFSGTVGFVQANVLYTSNGFGNFFLHESTCVSGDCFVINVGDFRSGVQSIAAAEATTPLPAALPLFATGLGTLGLLGWRRKKKASSLAA